MAVDSTGDLYIINFGYCVYPNHLCPFFVTVSANGVVTNTDFIFRYDFSPSGAVAVDASGGVYVAIRGGIAKYPAWSSGILRAETTN